MKTASCGTVMMRERTVSFGVVERSRLSILMEPERSSSICRRSENERAFAARVVLVIELAQGYNRLTFLSFRRRQSFLLSQWTWRYSSVQKANPIFKPHVNSVGDLLWRE